MKKSMLLASIAMVALLFACGGGEETSSAPAAPAAKIDPATAGTLQGTVILDGVPPEMTVIQMAADPNCACGCGPGARVQRTGAARHIAQAREPATRQGLRPGCARPCRCQ